MGEISLRRRIDPATNSDIYEVKLGDEYLMSSLFTAAETQMSNLALAETSSPNLDVIVGGLGLGYTARAVLTDPRVTSLTIIDTIAPVIDWHRRELLPHAEELTRDDRVQFVNSDFFTLATSTDGFDVAKPGCRYHVILLDIDHSPRHLLNPSHADFYTQTGLTRFAKHLHPGGMFALWSNDPADTGFLTTMETAFSDVEARTIAFDNPIQRRESTNTVYLARRPLT